MVRVVQTPACAGDLFTGNELSGWPDGIAYTPTHRRRKVRRKKPSKKSSPPVKPTTPQVRPLDVPDAPEANL